MKVILTSRIKTLGNIGDIKTVADGYGKNYLLPKKLALIYSEANYQSFKDKKETIEKLDQENKAKALENQKKIEAKEIVILENAGDNDRLYGSVNSVRIANFVNELIKSKDITKNEVEIPEPIKFLGKHKIIFELHPDVVFEKDIIVARSKEEAEKIKRAEKAKKAEEQAKKALEKVKESEEEKK